MKHSGQLEEKKYRRFGTNKSTGFTFVELLAVISLLSILIFAAAPIFTDSSYAAGTSARELIKAHLRQARAKAVSSGIATAVIIPTLESGDDVGARAISLLSVVRKESGYVPVVGSDGKAVLLQRWRTLPKNLHFVPGADLDPPRNTMMDAAEKVTVETGNGSFLCHLMVFASNGQIVFPKQGESLDIGIAEAVRKGAGLQFTHQSNGKSVFSLLRVNRLTGRTRSISQR
ncbi:Tfp pilus assembly protein FimT/FimU [Luteolibacter algae]|uniref:Tfp pilus assembly protein FimT/FimU n=1 Tax=Luteolibacter algae TaxID=454151 RepID=A0ABW5D3Q0_9BACT